MSDTNKKRTFDELAAEEAASVFYNKVCGPFLVGCNDRVRHLENMIEKYEKRVSFFENALPQCVTQCEGLEDLNCAFCNWALSCSDSTTGRMYVTSFFLVPLGFYFLKI